MNVPLRILASLDRALVAIHNASCCCKHRHRWNWAGCLLVFLLAMLGTADRAAAQNGSAAAQNGSAAAQNGNLEWQYRFDLFQMLLEQNGLEPVTLERATEELERADGKLVVVSMGQQTVSPILRRIRDVASHGKALIATDNPVHYQRLFMVQAGPVEATRSEDRYQGFADCVIINDFPKGSLVSNAKQLIVNRGGWLANLDNDYGTWTIHARYPRRVRNGASASKPLLASMTIRGRQNDSLFVLADQSLLSNGMIWHGDNAMLAIQLSYLLAQGGGKLLFIVDGAVIPSYTRPDTPGSDSANFPPLPPLDNLPPEAIPKPTLEQLLTVLNRVATKVEDSDLINEVLVDQPRSIREPYYRRLLLLIGSVLLLIYAIYRLSKPPSVPTSPATTLAIGPPPLDTREDFATAEQRGVAARFLARDFFIEHTGSTDARKWREAFLSDMTSPKDAHSKQHPITGSVPEMDTIGYLISIADSTKPLLMTAAQLAKCGTAIEALRASSTAAAATVAVKA